ncbi:MAG TPA: hypothetical protein VHY20_05515 [Pirellulales bacterium]|nr:hypothetical protein [Pirellulales bacterium]
MSTLKASSPHSSGNSASLAPRADRPSQIAAGAPGNAAPGNAAPGNAAPGNAAPGNGAPGNGVTVRTNVGRALGHKDIRIARRFAPALQLLEQAYEYAVDTGRDLEDFAVELPELRRRGMTNSDCRWLVCKGWSYLLREVKPRSAQGRRFRHDVGLAIVRGSCLVLTPEGVRLARKATDGVELQRAELQRAELQRAELQFVAERLGSESAVDRLPAADGQNVRLVPHWDRDRHELRLGSHVVKQFKLLSPNQEIILTVFDEENWPARIDDPLPPSKRVNSKQRLHDTIKNLNRKQKNRLVRFLGDGTGQGVRWELMPEAAELLAGIASPRDVHFPRAAPSGT